MALDAWILEPQQVHWAVQVAVLEVRVHCAARAPVIAVWVLWAAAALEL